MRVLVLWRRLMIFDRRKLKKLKEFGEIGGIGRKETSFDGDGDVVWGWNLVEVLVVSGGNGWMCWLI